MSTIVLHGALRREFGGPFNLEVASPAEAFRALEANFPGRFFAAVRDGLYRIVRGHPKTGLALGEDELGFRLGSADLHVIPLARGSAGQRSKGAVKAVIGVAMIAVAIASSGAGTALIKGGWEAFAAKLGTGLVSWSTVAMTGLTMTLQGVSAMLSPQPKAMDLQPVDQRQSFLFSGPVNLTEQGGAVPLIYGRCRVGSTTISAGIDVEQLPFTLTDPAGAILVTDPTPLPGPGGTTSGGLVITAKDGAALTGFRIAGIDGGTLKRKDGSPIANDTVLTLAEGAAGLIFDLAGDETAEGASVRGLFTVTGVRADNSTFGNAVVVVNSTGSGSPPSDH